LLTLVTLSWLQQTGSFATVVDFTLSSLQQRSQSLQQVSHPSEQDGQGTAQHGSCASFTCTLQDFLLSGQFPQLLVKSAFE
jgi:hypothetical protein